MNSKPSKQIKEQFLDFAKRRYYRVHCFGYDLYGSSSSSYYYYYYVE